MAQKYNAHTGFGKRKYSATENWDLLYLRQINRGVHQFSRKYVMRPNV